MKEICIDARMAFHSGIGTYIRNLLPYLKRAFPSIRVLAPLSFIQKWPELKDYEIIPVEASIYSVKEQWHLPLRVPSCDLFWSPHYNAPLSPLRAKKRLVTIHDVYHLRGPFSWKERLYAKMMIKNAAFQSDHIITVSQFSLGEIHRETGVAREKITVIPNGVDQNLFSKQSQQPPENYFIYVGTLAPHKNLSRLFKAWDLVLQKHAGWRLIVVGKRGKNFDGPIPQTIQHLDSVEDQDLPSLYQKAYGMVYPSLYEGFGLPPLEAMCMECPTIVSHAASLPEVCGDASLYVDPFSEHDIAQKICTLIENPSLRQTLIKKGRQRIDLFSWEKAAQDHISAINRLV
jgi:glycosyltransferase involved in cell wall biosynthesis